MVLWLAALSLCGSGLALALRADRPATLTAAAGLLLTIGAAAVFAARCLTAHETVLTRVSLRVGFGPFARALPCHDLRFGASRPATSWRRFYADSELLLEVAAGGRWQPVWVPTHDPAGLTAALAPPPRA